ncbi:UDP-glucose 4-epimerase [Chloroherpeton thalassium ATCC 35110]|uniref:UDP-glucose 4-epimerase n=1 Tax=Chloroherpeton thalassium (strain ATCC 35110 / GB-78) TaxID=517418 RepID=B3QSC9_CHLT3|nr:UDP-glucose 4-epimerase GalE [Chloroherpeton thalassium]ACF12520.1 UDP-glucose 4-epimerase [Chloroherpeton thalassium ATCC 35110]
MTVLITGGAGYIGSHAVRRLKQAGYKTLVLDNLVYGHSEFVEADELIIGDLENTKLLNQVFSKHKIQAVMHFAAYAYVGESVQNPAKYYRNNVASTLNLLDAMLAYKVKKFIFSSTCATYGEPDEIPITETHPQRPINPYGQSKLMVEKILDDYDHAYDLRSVRLRYFNAAGADPDGGIGEDHDPETHLIPLVLDAALERRAHISMFGTDYDTPDGTCVRDYIHVTDLAEAHVLGLKYLENGGKTDFFNLGNGNGFSVKEVIETARKITGKEIPAKIAPRRPGDPASLVGSSEKIKSALGWKPQFPDLPAIIETAWQWHKTRFGRTAQT